MTMHNPPQYRYPFFEQWDKEAFTQIKEIGKTKKYPAITGSFEDKNQFLLTLIRSQKSLHGWRAMFVDVLKQVSKNNIINTVELNKQYPLKNIVKSVPAWVTYKEDEIVNNFIDELGIKKVTFQGTDKEFSEFIVRFILGQLGNDWEQTIMMIWEMLSKGSMLYLSELNNELKNFDYSKILE